MSHDSTCRCPPVGRAFALSLILLASAGLCANARAAAEDVDDLLSLSIEELFDVTTTTASKIEETTDIAPATVYVITQEQIESLGLRDLEDVLRLVPGVDVVNPHFFLEGGQRGFIGPFSQSLILVNGREMNNLIAGETFISNQFRTHNIKQVEIIAGPGSALYGANAVAGVINIITKSADDVQGVELLASYGSWNTREASVVFGYKTNDFKISGSFGLYKSEGQDFSDYLSDTAEASPSAENNSYRTLPKDTGYDSEEDAIPFSLYLENRGLYAGVEYYRNTTGRGTSGIQWDYNDGEDYRELWLSYVGYRLDDLLDDKLDVKAEYRYYTEKFWGNHTEGEGPLIDPDTGDEITVGATPEDIEDYRGFYSNKDSDGSQKQVGLVEATYQVSDNNTLIGGVQYEYADVVSANFSRTNGVHPPIGDEQEQPEFSNYKTGVYLQDQIKLLDKELTATLGARYEDHERYGSTFIPRGGLVWQPVKDSIFKLLYGKSFREPTVFELRNGPGIQPMEMETYEIGWHQYLGKHFRNEAVVFWNKATDVIVADSTLVGGISNKGEQDAEGFEDQISFNYGPWKGFVNYTYTTSELDQPETGLIDVLDIPEHKANAALSYAFHEHYSAGLVVRWRDEVDTSYRDEIYTIDDYVVCDLVINAINLPWFVTDSRLDVIVKNVFDDEYYDPEPRAPSVVKNPQDERSLFVQLAIKI